MKRIVFLSFMILGLSAIAAAQVQLTCQSGVETIRGTYLVSSEGWLTIPGAGYVTPTLFPGAILGVMSIDSNGNLSGSATVAGLSDVAEYESKGTVTLKADCTGVMKFKNISKKTGYGSDEEDKFIVVANGNDLEIHAITTNIGPGIVPVMLVKWKRIAYKSNAAVW